MMHVWVNRCTAEDDHVMAGVLGRAEERRYVFAYDLQCTSAYAVSLTMPVDPESYVFDELHPVFQMNLPEGDLRETIRLRFSKALPGFDDLDVLGLIGSSQIGRLRFSTEPTTSVVPPQSIAEILHATDTEGLLLHLMERYSAVSGVSGVQPKVLVREDEDEAVPSLHNGRVTVHDATHIVKTFVPREYPELAANEYFCMQVAARAGLQIPHLQLSDNGRFLVVERFDRTEHGGYLGFEDFCSLNGLGTKNKYLGTYERLAKRIAEFVDPDLKGEAMRAFFTSFAVTCAVQNGDAHLKNFGVLYEDADSAVRFAPTYDIVSTTLYVEADTLALTLGGSKRFPNAKKLHDFGRVHCGLSNAQTAEIMERIADAISATSGDVRQYMSDRPEFRDVGEKLLAIWDTGLATALTLPRPKVAKASRQVPAASDSDQ